MDSLYEQLIKYRDSDAYAFHMPGHKRKPVGSFDALSAAYGIDITEIEGFDNLHQPEGIIKEAQCRAAALYGAEETFFLVNGSTCGVLAAIAAATEKGDRILMARNCHRSAYHAAFLQELSVSCLYPGVRKDYKITDAVDPALVKQELDRQRACGEKEASAVVVTSPTYEGVTSDIAALADTVHSYGKILIVDEAHGAHFGFHKAFPENAVRQGADLVVHSLHKTLPAMTQTALLHVSGGRVDRERLRRYLGIFQTSSPSYVLMASADSCLKEIRKQGAAFWEPMLYYRARLLKRLTECRRLELIGPPFPEERRIKEMDAGKLVIGAKDGSIGGKRLYDLLRERYHLQMEMAAERYVVGILTPADTREGMDRLAHALTEIDRDITVGIRKGGKAAGRKEEVLRPTESEMETAPLRAVMTIAQAYSRPFGINHLEECAGKIAAEFITPYPPGIPLAAPGEELTEEIIARTLACIHEGLSVQGVENNRIKTVRTEGE